MKIKKIKQDTFNINIISTSKFKTTKIQLVLANDIPKENITPRALVPYLLEKATKAHPTKEKLADYLEGLYQSSIHVKAAKSGLSHFLLFELNMINDDYTLDHEPLLLKGLTVLKDILFNPVFNRAYFEEEKRLFANYFDRLYADKMQFTIKELKDALFKDDPYGKNALGTEESLKTVTLKDVKDAYQTMLTDDLININVIGDIDEEEITQVLNDTFKFKPRQKTLTLIDHFYRTFNDPQLIIKHKHVKQAKLAIGYRFPIYYGDDDYYAAVVFNTLLGGGSNSLLFDIIREEKGYAYYISSHYDYFKGTLYIFLGLDEKNRKDTTNDIDQMINSLKTTVDASYLDIAKKSIINDFLQSLDSSGSLASRLLNLSLFDKPFDPDLFQQKINAITKEDIKRVANKIKKDTTCLLRNDPNDKT
ncbi:MAG: insulinase family protein [Candidatus Izimaplasma sp.]|nr:insulinase family protein [Candidatus Izimaplasma bacterium]